MLATITDQAKMEKMIRTMMIALPSGVAVIQMRHNSDSANVRNVHENQSDQASRPVELCELRLTEWLKRFGCLETSEPAAFKQSKFFHIRDCWEAGQMWLGLSPSPLTEFWIVIFTEEAPPSPQPEEGEAGGAIFVVSLRDSTTGLWDVRDSLPRRLQAA